MTEQEPKQKKELPAPLDFFWKMIRSGILNAPLVGAAFHNLQKQPWFSERLRESNDEMSNRIQRGGRSHQ